MPKQKTWDRKPFTGSHFAAFLRDIPGSLAAAFLKRQKADGFPPAFPQR